MIINSSAKVGTNSIKTECDVAIIGGGIAGLWMLNILTSKGFNVILIDNKSIGGTQTCASQGMIHGGQRYLLGGNSSTHAESVAGLPQRWRSCLEGHGEIDLRRVSLLSSTQFMWPAGGLLTNLALNAAVQTLSAKTIRLEDGDIPFPLSDSLGRTVFQLPEMVLDIRSLIEVLAYPHRSRIGMCNVDALERDGRIIISGQTIKAQLVICAAGLGNEDLIALLETEKCYTQRRPIRQIMVKTMPFQLFGHAITTSYKPRITVTSHPLPAGGFVWYIGGAIADKVLSLTEEDAIACAKEEMLFLFPHIEWTGKEWATWCGTRAEAYSSTGRLPDGPVIQEYGSVLCVWPTKLTLTPRLGDQVLDWLVGKGIQPEYCSSFFQSLNLPVPPMETLPWEQANWRI
jgi:glycine/D-amino acid oxidase-like deaminating enzyme